MTANSARTADSRLLAFCAAIAVLFSSFFAVPAIAGGILQCVPYARQISGIDIQGNARFWWGKAEGRYDRGNTPEAGAVLAFQSTSSMPHGHVATVREVLSDRRIVLDHANWSSPGQIERHAVAEDVSAANDWSDVRVWYGPINALGRRSNPTFGFIYNRTPSSNGSSGSVLAIDTTTRNVTGG